MSEEISGRIGDYEVLGTLGSGGMGKVYKVRNVISDRIEAMKVLLPDLAGRQDLADRFLREIKLLAGLNHPNIAALRTALTLNNQLVMIMEYVEGTTLAARLEQGRMPLTDAFNYMDQLLGALSYAHQQHVIHRDIKPANMMLTPEGVVKLMDFGIARSAADQRLTRTGTSVGSPYYMSPEQVKGQATDERSDLYSLAVSFYEMVTGQVPFHADSEYSLMAAHLQQQPKPPTEVRPDLPAALDGVILMAMSKEPTQRFQSADAFRNALGSVKENSPVATQWADPGLPVGTRTMHASRLDLGAGLVSPGYKPPPAALMHQSTTASVVPPPQQSQPIPPVLEPPARHNSHRGLYVALGASMVLAVLVVAAVYVPRREKINAHEPASAAQPGNPTTSFPNSTSSGNPDGGDTIKPQPADSTGSSSQNPGTAIPSSGQALGQTQPSRAPRDTASHGPRKKADVTLSTGQGNQEMAAQTVQKTPAPSAQLEDLEQQADQLSSQASAINDSLDNLRRQQTAQGLSLRGDIASAQERMKTHLARAQSALQNRDAQSAKKYLDLAEGDVVILDNFLGR